MDDSTDHPVKRALADEVMRATAPNDTYVFKCIPLLDRGNFFEYAEKRIQILKNFSLCHFEITTLEHVFHYTM